MKEMNRILGGLVKKLEDRYEADRPNFIMNILQDALEIALRHKDPVNSFYFRTENIQIAITGDIGSLLEKARKKNAIIFRGQGGRRIISVPFGSGFKFDDRSPMSKGKNIFLEHWWSARLISRSIVEINYLPGEKVYGTHTSDGSGWPKSLISR